VKTQLRIVDLLLIKNELIFDIQIYFVRFNREPMITRLCRDFPETPDYFGHGQGG